MTIPSESRTSTDDFRSSSRTSPNPASFSTKQLACLLAFLVSFQSPAVASTHQRRSGNHRPSFYSSDHCYPPTLYPYNYADENSPHQIDFSEDEDEEKVLSALAKTEEDSASSFDENYSTSDYLPQRKNIRKKRKKRRRRKLPQRDFGKQSTSTYSDAKAEALSQPESSGSPSIQTEKEANVGSRTSRTSTLEASFNLSAASTISESEPQQRQLNSRLEELEMKLRRASDVDKSVEPHSLGLSGRPWGVRHDPLQASQPSIPAPKSTATKTSVTKYPPSKSPQSRPPSKTRTPPPPASKVRSYVQTTTTRANGQQTSPQTPSRTKPKPRNVAVPTAMKIDPNVSPWVRKFHSTRPKDCLVLVPRDFIVDNFNLARLAPVVEHLANRKQKELEASSPNLEHRGKSRIRPPPPSKHATTTSYPIYRQALDLILTQDNDAKEEPPPVVQYAAEVLYSLIHARFVVSPRGLETIRSRLIVHGSKSINQPLFGRCPRLDCGGMPLLPCGLSDDFEESAANQIGNCKAKRYCCNCKETFHCWESKVDGSAWGTSLCHLLLMVFGKRDLFPSHFATPYKQISKVEPRGRFGYRPVNQTMGMTPTRTIFGFPVHPSAA